MKNIIKYEKRDYMLAFRDTEHSSHGLVCDRHFHYHIELVMMERGECEVRIDDSTFVAREGDIFIVFPNQSHDYTDLSATEYSLAIISPNMVSEFQRIITSARPLENIIRGAAKRQDIYSDIKNLSANFYSNEQNKEAILSGYATVLMGKLLPMLKLETRKISELNSLDSIMSYCINNFDKPLSLEVLERELHISKYYISHVMREKLNVGFNDYVNSLRVSNACVYLIKTDMSVTAISYAVGFNSIRTFNRVFLKQMKTSPKEYRARSI